MIQYIYAILNPPLAYRYFFSFSLTLLIGIVVIWLYSIDSLSAYIYEEMPPGQFAYVCSKLFGLLSIAALNLQILLGILYVERQPNLHRLFANILVLCVLCHIILFFIAASLRSESLQFHILVPDFTHGYYKSSVSIGIVATFLLFLVVASGKLRMRTDRFCVFPVIQKIAHRTAYLVVILAFIHSLWIGTETRQLTLMVLYVSFIGSIVFGLVYRYYMLVNQER